MVQHGETRSQNEFETFLCCLNACSAEDRRGAAEKDCGQVFNVTESKCTESPEMTLKTSQNVEYQCRVRNTSAIFDMNPTTCRETLTSSMNLFQAGIDGKSVSNMRRENSLSSTRVTLCRGKFDDLH